MHNYQEQLHAQIVTFDRYLQTMVQRRAQERNSDCAITFMEDHPDDLDLDHLVESRARVLETSKSEAVSEERRFDFLSEATFIVPEPTPPSCSGSHESGKEKSVRYVQFAFMKRTFYMDLPNSTIFPAEVHRLMRDRSGFFYLRQRRWSFMTFEEWREVVHDHDPLQKEYLNVDTRCAAEDMAYVIYNLWRFPLDWQFYYHALRFNQGKRRPWERTGTVK